VVAPYLPPILLPLLKIGYSYMHVAM